MLTQKSLEKAALFLADRDETLAKLLSLNGLPPLWAREPGFPTLIHIILEQQVSLASAKATFRRLTGNMSPFTPKTLLNEGIAQLKSLGVTRQKASYCVNLAEAIIYQELDLDALSGLDDQTVMATLTQIKGIGPWTANIYLLMALRRPDIWPSGDIALATAVRRVKNIEVQPSPEELSKISEIWRPFRSVAARMLWHYYLRVCRRNKESPAKKSNRPIF